MRKLQDVHSQSLQDTAQITPSLTEEGKQASGKESELRELTTKTTNPRTGWEERESSNNHIPEGPKAQVRRKPGGHWKAARKPGKVCEVKLGKCLLENQDMG